MAEIVNLRRARKAKLRQAASAEAAANRARHGRTAADRERERMLAEQARRLLDVSLLDANQREDG